MHASGEHDIATIARVLGVSRASVYRALAATAEPDRKSGPAVSEPDLGQTE
jgi:DNA-binding phage protein